MSKKLFLVLIPSNINTLLSYATADENISEGDIVFVPLRKKITVGVVWQKDQKDSYDYEIKDIIEKAHNFNLDQNTRSFIDSFSTENLSVMGLVLKMVLGPFVRRHKIIIKKISQEKNVLLNNDIETKPLSKEQQNVFDAIVKSQGVSVLDGVTGSGKTELYLQVAKKIVDDGGQVLILLPEILLTTQIIERAKVIMGNNLHSWHSNVKQKDKDLVWTGVQDKSIRCVIGARSALLLPFSNLKMIIVDEEHDISFKQETSPIYNARDMAVLRAKISNIPVVLTSATPSIETMYHVQQGHYRYFHLNQRNFSEAKLEIKVANMWDVSNKNDKVFPMLHPMSLDEISKTIAAGEQILIFLNRKGYAATTICSSCMSTVRCKNCDIKLTHYKYKKQLKCRHCGYIITEQKTCSTCGQESLYTYHPGVEKLHEELTNYFPHARILTVTRDTLEQEDTASVIQKISNHEVDIVIGTQVLAKGLHFPKMGLCIIVDANNQKFSGDIRSFERTHQLLQQVIGRVGREKRGLAIIQTLNKKSPVINSIASGSKQDFIKLELANREAAGVPPYGTFVLINISSGDEKRLHKWLLSTSIPESSTNIKVFGPIPAAIHRMHKKYRYQILFKGSNRKEILKTVERWLNSIQIPHYISVIADVDPQSFY